MKTVDATWRETRATRARGRMRQTLEPVHLEFHL